MPPLLEEAIASVPDDLPKMPVTWMQHLNQASIQADADWLRSLADQIPSEYGGLSQRLLELAGRFEFETIAGWVESVLDG